MPQAPQILDFGPNYGAMAAGRFGQGFADQYLRNDQQNRESDALRDIFSKITPESQPQDVIRDIFSSRGLDFEKKKTAASAITDVLEKTRKVKEDQVKEKKKELHKEKLIKAGLPQKFAEIYADSTVGGQTEWIKFLREYHERHPETPDYAGILLNDGENLTGAPERNPVSGQMTPGASPVNADPQYGQFQAQMPQPQDMLQSLLGGQPQMQGAGQLPLMTPEMLAEQAGLQAPKPLPPKQAAKPSRDINDVYKGKNPKEINEIQNARYKVQTPLYKTLTDKVTAAENDLTSINSLKELNTRPDLDDRQWNINPFNSQLIIPKLAPESQQAWQKTVNNFVSRAKEFFGSRVTNFDLEAFMKRLPGLANSAEGRSVIIHEMELAGQLMELEQGALRDVIDEYGVRNIDWSDAEKLARDRTKPERERIEKEIGQINNFIDSDEREKIKQAKTKVQKGYVLMRTPGGDIKQFPRKNLEVLQDKGYEKL